MNVGINGFGRIGRAVFRINEFRKKFQVVKINDINTDIKNVAYLLKYDSIYGRFLGEVAVGKNGISVNGQKIRVSDKKDISSVSWEGCDVVIDASGVLANVLDARRLKKQGVQAVIVTHSPDPKHVDKTLIMGVNENTFRPKSDFLVSSSICDANAFAPVVNELHKAFGVVEGFLTTLHPWLNYQNLLDGPSNSFAYPGQIHSHYPLGRASLVSLIPKPTSAVRASEKVLGYLKGKFMSVSYRVPTHIVGSADITVKLKKKFAVPDIIALFTQLEKKQEHKIFHNNFEPLVSIDFLASEYSAVIDHRWTHRSSDNYLKLLLWYDNEWGYSCRVVDLVQHVKQQLSGAAKGPSR